MNAGLKVVFGKICESAVNVIVVPVRVIHLVAARAASVRAEDGDQSGEDRAEQRQEDNGLNHRTSQPFIRLMSSTAIEPRLR